MHHFIVFLGNALHSLKCPSAPRRSVREIHWGVRLLTVVGNGDKLRQRGATWFSIRAHPSWGESTLRGWITLFLSVCLPVCWSVIMTIQVSEKEWARLHVYHTVCLG